MDKPLYPVYFGKEIRRQYAIDVQFEKAGTKARASVLRTRTHTDRYVPQFQLTTPCQSTPRCYAVLEGQNRESTVRIREKGSVVRPFALPYVFL